MGSSVNGHGNAASSVKMYYWDPVKDTGGVTAVQDRDCVDDSAYLPAGDVEEPMFYTWDDLVHHNFHKNELDSLMIPIGYEVTIYKNDGFAGDHETYYGKEKDGRIVCQNVTMDNDTVSMTVKKQRYAGAWGRWQ